MKITMTTKDFKQALRLVKKAANNKQVTLVQRGILIFAASRNMIGLLASDLDEKEILTHIPADIHQPGFVVIAGDQVNSIIQNLDGPITILETTPGEKVSVKSGPTQTFVTAFPPDKFRGFNHVNRYKPTEKHTHTANFDISQRTLKGILKRTLYAVSKDHTRPALANVLFSTQSGMLTVVATDTYRLSVSKEAIRSTDQCKALVPNKILRDLATYLDPKSDDPVAVFFTPTMVDFSSPSTTFQARLVEDSYANYEKLIPTDFTKWLTVYRNSLINILRIAAAIDKETHHTIFRIKQGELTIEVNPHSKPTPDFSSTLYANYEYIDDEPVFNVAFNAKYLLETLKSLEGEKIYFSMAGPYNSVLVTDNKITNHQHIIMPMEVFKPKKDKKC